MKALLSGKRVAIVGRAGSILGTGQGAEIDAADVVVRINWLLPTAPEHQEHCGTRTDLVYTCRRCATARKLAAEAGVRSLTLSSARRRAVTRYFFTRKKGLRASTGLVCVADCIRAGAKRIHLYGFDLMRSEHFQERTPDGNSPAGSSTGRWLHNWEAEADAWRKLLKKYRRVKADRIFREALR